MEFGCAVAVEQRRAAEALGLSDEAEGQGEKEELPLRTGRQAGLGPAYHWLMPFRTSMVDTVIMTGLLLELTQLS